MAEEPKSNIGIINNNYADERHARWQAENKDTQLKVGDYCKMGFIIEKGSPVKEHMWVCITKPLGNDMFEGILDNDPQQVPDIKCGDMVSFSKSEVSDLSRG